MRLFSDQKRLLLKQYQGAGAVIGSDLADEAIGQAYRQIGTRLGWSYLHRRTQINTVAAVSTGTVAYTASTRVLTLSGSTWPTWVTQGLLKINSSIYAVESQSSATEIVLVADRSPVSDIASGSTYTLFQSEYVLPANFVRSEELVPIGQWWLMEELPPGSMLETARLFSSPTRPWQYLFRGSSFYPGRMAIEFGPPPSSAFTIDMTYYSQPRQRTLPVEYTTGTVSVSGTAVTGTGTAFTQSMVGCRLRQGTAAAVPVGEYGALGSVNENTILSVTDGTHLTLQDSGATLGGVKFMIDDPVDVARDSMDEVFCRMCEYEFENLFHGDKREEKRAELTLALVRARGMDVRTSPKHPRPAYVPSLEAMAAASVRFGQ